MLIVLVFEMQGLEMFFFFKKNSIIFESKQNILQQIQVKNSAIREISYLKLLAKQSKVIILVKFSKQIAQHLEKAIWEIIRIIEVLKQNAFKVESNAAKFLDKIHNYSHDRSSRMQMFHKKAVLKNSQENTCARVSL